MYVYVCVLSSHLFWTSDLWTHQPGSHRRKVTQDFSTFLLRCLPQFLWREGFSRPFSSSTVKSIFVYARINRSPCMYVCMLLLLLLFLTFSVLVANPKKLLYTVANPARGLLNREKRTKEKVWQHTPPPPTPHTARSEKINKITRRIYRRYAGGRSRVRTRIPSARRLGLWVWLRICMYVYLGQTYEPGTC